MAVTLVVAFPDRQKATPPIPDNRHSDLRAVGNPPSPWHVATAFATPCESISATLSPMAKRPLRSAKPSYLFVSTP